MEVVPSAEENTQSRMAENSLVLSRREWRALWGGIDSASRAYEAGTLLDLGCRSMRHRLLHGVRWFETLRRESAVSNFQTQPRDQEGNQQRTVSRNSLE
ncbi:GD10368 [Drosophila simulans]|uniref:GD10368 n=1 Tax=Drosophila simulans TaxID=7240 RepID=B4QC30_DROSI|nr:GD10368 [Drosophila simulans]